VKKEKIRGKGLGSPKKNSGIGQPRSILICGQLEVHFGQFTRLSGLGNFAMLH